MSCFQQLPTTEPEEPEKTLYCRTEKRIVSNDEAAAWCYPGGHLIDESTDERGAA